MISLSIDIDTSKLIYTDIKPKLVLLYIPELNDTITAEYEATAVSIALEGLTPEDIRDVLR